VKLLTFNLKGQDRLGAMTASGDRIVDLAAASGSRPDPAFVSMLSLIVAGEAALDTARDLAASAERSGQYLLAPSEVTPRAPLPIPEQIRDFSVFPRHIVQSRIGMERLARELLGIDISVPGAGTETPELPRKQPLYYITNRFSVIGDGADVIWPAYTNYMDFELEIAAIIGKAGKDISSANAQDHIFGYTIYNDFTARDAQLTEMLGMLGPAKGKSFDMGNAMGPVIVTRDEIADVRALGVRVRVNGRVFADETCGAMLHGFEDMIAFVSRDETIHPGEVFGSGTVGGCCGLETSRFLNDGDLIELEVDRIGILANRVKRR